MKRRLIDRDALVKEISEAQTQLETNDDRMWELNKPYHKGLAWAHLLTLNAPTVDAVEVVRCKDCDFSRPIYQENGSVFEGPLHCFHGRGYQMNTFDREYSVINPDNFCASGRRKMGGEMNG